MLTQKVKDKFNYFSTHDHPSKDHFFTFYHFGKKCDRIIEMGVDYGTSTWAWVAADPKYLRAVDIRRWSKNQICPGTTWGGQMDEIEEEADKMKLDFKFEIGDTGHGILNEIQKKFNKITYPQDQVTLPHYNIEGEIDLLFIDTYHSYTHLKAELAIHGNKVRKYLIFHDTEYFGMRHDHDGDLGLNFAINEFLAENKNWQYLHKVDYCNGLTVLGNMDNVDDVPNMNPLFRYPSITL
jgi:hypothetical protein